MSQPVYDVIVIGAGAAGLMAAIFCREKPLNVLLLDSREKIGAKILMSGGTRCNVTNEKVSEKDFNSETIRTVRNILRAFPPEKAADFFRKLGVELALEPGGKYFPATHSGRTILEALMNEAEKRGVIIETGKKVTDISHCEPARHLAGGEAIPGLLRRCAPRNDNAFHISGEGFEMTSRAVVLCTGGLSFPGTGSDGSGYRMAQSFGHRLVQTTPSLTPLCTSDPEWKALAGISLPCRLTLEAHKKKSARYEGSFLFTHFGFSGPCALNLSRHWIREGDSNKQVFANFLPFVEENHYRKILIESVVKYPKKRLKNFLSSSSSPDVLRRGSHYADSRLKACGNDENRACGNDKTSSLPERFVETILKKSCIDSNLVLNQLSSADRERLLGRLFHYPLEVNGSLGYEKAEVTAGGVDLSEVDRKTLESKLQPGLFFAGEILDVDGRIGGFNFQWAWSSGVVTARGVGAALRHSRTSLGGNQATSIPA